jgi:hypothetical protein
LSISWPPVPGASSLRPAEAAELPGEELALPAQFLGFGVHVIHELVDQSDGDLLDLALGVGHFAHEDVAGGVDAAAGVDIKHKFQIRETRDEIRAEDTSFVFRISYFVFPLFHEFVQHDIVLDVVRDALAPGGRHGFVVLHGEGRVGVEFGQAAVVDDVAQAAVGGVGLEEVARFGYGVDGDL